MTDQIIELETKIAFLEKHINELSDVLYTQQQAIDKLEKSYGLLRGKFESQYEESHADNKIEKPPHY